MFELSPLVTAMNASASLIPASSSSSRSNPNPTIVRASNPGGRRSNAEGRLSMIVTSWPALASWMVSSEPTLPHPTMITRIAASAYPTRLAVAGWDRGARGEGGGGLGRLDGSGSVRRVDLVEVEGNDGEVDVLVAAERLRDPAARPVVQDALSELRVVAPRHDDRDLAVRSGLFGHVALEGARDVPVPALDDVERNGQSELHPPADHVLLEIGVHGRVHRPHVGRTERERVPDGADHGAIDLVDQHDDPVAAPRDDAQAGPTADGFGDHVPWRRVILDRRHAHAPVRQEGPRELRARPAAAEPFPDPHPRGAGDDHVHVPALGDRAHEAGERARQVAVAADDLQRDVDAELPPPLLESVGPPGAGEVHRGDALRPDGLGVLERVHGLAVEVLDEQDHRGLADR